jgi:hypothetical protein
MGSTRKKIDGSVHLDDALAASLARLGQAVRARNSASAKTSSEKAGQAELSPDNAPSIAQDSAEVFGVFDDDAIENLDMPTEHIPLDSLDALRDSHRTLSEQIVAGNCELARIARLDNLDSTKVRAVRDYLAALQASRAGLDAVIEDRQRAETRTSAPTIDNQALGGLVKVRHPNRDFFLADLFDYTLKDDGASMEAPIFTLATKPDLSIWEWTSRDGNKSVRVMPSVLGRATQHDKDVLIYVVSQMTEGLNRGRDDAKNRTVRFTVYDYLVTTNRGVGGDDYRRLQESFDRLAGTRIKTDIRTGGQRVTDNFGILERVRIVEKSQGDERMTAVDVTLSEWLYNAIQAHEVLSIHPDYFRLRKPMARRLYELARKHCGHQAQWKIGLELLQAKAGSKSSLKEFRRAVRAIEADNSLPEYRLVLNDNDTVTFHNRDAKKLLASIVGRS